MPGMRSGWVLVGVLTTVVAVTTVITAAQARPQPAGQVAAPDAAGFRPGMTVQDAYARLKAYPIKGGVRPGAILIPELAAKPLPRALQLSESGEYSAEVIQLDLSLPPSQQVVWRVSRRQNFPAGQEMALTSVVTALQEKYGEGLLFGQQTQTAARQLYWFFDERGRRDPAPLRDCIGVMGIKPTHVNLTVDQQNYSLEPHDLIDAQKPCAALTVVVASLTAHLPDLVNGLHVAITDVGLMTQWHRDTVNAIAQAREKQNQQEIEKAKQRRPTL